MDMQGKVAMVTGAGSGIGAAIAQAMAQAGARGVVVADLDLERAQAVAAGIGAQALALRCDVAAEPQIQAAVQATRDRFGALDVYVSNAGILASPAASSSTMRCGSACGAFTAWPMCGPPARWCRTWWRAAKAPSWSRPRRRAC